MRERIHSPRVMQTRCEPRRLPVEPRERREGHVEGRKRGEHAVQATELVVRQVGVVDERVDQRHMRRHPVGAVARQHPPAGGHDRRDVVERHDDRGGRHRRPGYTVSSTAGFAVASSAITRDSVTSSKCS